ncbi:MAG: HepT-like ribonuclease domain-containing protein, partial [Streptosporangiaceae bacterium]
MQRDILLLTEMIDAAEQAHQLTAGITGQLETDRQRRDALLWNFTVLGEAAGQLSTEVKERFPDIAWQQPIRL